MTNVCQHRARQKHFAAMGTDDLTVNRVIGKTDESPANGTVEFHRIPPKRTPSRMHILLDGMQKSVPSVLGCQPSRYHLLVCKQAFSDGWEPRNAFTATRYFL